MSLKIAIIGAGSVYTPEIIEGLAQSKEKLPVTELTLMDINPDRLEIMYNFLNRYKKFHQLSFAIRKTECLEEAVKGQDFILTQIRVGGNQARIHDEKIPLKYDVIGQETTGPGGYMKALRTIPAIVEIAKAVEKHNPEAWLINYANPTGILAEAVRNYTKTKFIALCAGGMRPRTWVGWALDANYKEVTYDFVGLNHMNFTYNIRVDGRKITKEEFDKVADIHETVAPELIKKLNALPSLYCQYYFHRRQKLAELKEAPLTRGETVLGLEKEIYTALKNPSQHDKPEILKSRGGGGYSELALEALSAIYNDEDMWIVANVKNERAIEFLPYDASVETPCILNKNGITPLVQNNIPVGVYGLVSAVKNYESLVVQAAIEGNYDKALEAMVAHPLVGDFDIAKPMLDEMLKVNAPYIHPDLVAAVTD
ncbi:6-phospho-beta-glucosidase [Enterococcus faecalis]|uniref:6-phospho-beta-glucosidase n=1 Tax=Enterococcus faecalis TaxID=1351 RepID=UPI00155EEB1E|nr:6-phospho-beta-glucosidase [Enterococcus faecalis]MDT2124755.1 6-phospho-beta-glucosidase [Enterococcus faecalis]NRC72917.1 6-phospho-beta-glucosidase [Enterococcus faecalis]